MYKSIAHGTTSKPVRVLLIAQDTDLPKSWASIRQVAEAAARPGFRRQPGEIAVAGDRAVLVGLGEADRLTIEKAVGIGVGLVKALDRAGVAAASLESVARDPAIPAALLGRSIGEGLAIGNWRLLGFEGTATEREAPKGSLRISGVDRDLDRGLAEGLGIGECVNFARRLQATPPNVAHPGWIAAEARALGRSHGLRVRVISFAEAKRLGMGGLVNVGMASQRKPCLVLLEHGPKSGDAPHLAIVGKTITYDTGGYSLKTGNGMKGMKYDKSGGCAVLGAMRAIAEAKLPIRATAALPAAENMVGGDAYRPDDVVTMFNGVTCEVTNTDAEGRLVLADALAWIAAKSKPDAVVDLATLTGGVVVALGNHCAGYFCEHPEFASQVEAAATASGERVWRLPLWESHRRQMRSRYADIVNSGAKRGAHPIQGAAFLSHFVPADLPWAHIDIAGVADDEGHDHFGTGPTGYGVRLVLELARAFGAASNGGSGRTTGRRTGRAASTPAKTSSKTSSRRRR
jgi:leucyl aminopeptidase